MIFPVFYLLIPVEVPGCKLSLLQAFNVTSFPSYKPSMLRVLPSLKAIACQFSHKDTLQEKFCQLFEH